MRGPRFQQRAVHREVLVADQILQPRQQHRVLEEALRDPGVEQSLAIERGRRVIPYRIIHVQAGDQRNNGFQLSCSISRRSLRAL